MSDDHIWCPRCSAAGMLPSGIVCPRCKGKQTIPAPAAPAEGEDRVGVLTDSFINAVYERLNITGHGAVNQPLVTVAHAIINEWESQKLGQLTARLTELEAIAEELAEAGERAMQLRPHRMPEALAKLAAWKEKSK